MRRILVFDTSVLCVWLKVPGKSRCTTFRDTGGELSYTLIQKLIEKEEKEGSTFVLPLAAIIETGNHIAQAKGDRFSVATAFVDLIRKTADAHTPWAAFTEQAGLWDGVQLKEIARDFPRQASAKFSIGDMTIKRVAEYYAKAGWHVSILTCDRGLQAYEPAVEPRKPRRRSE